MSAARHILAERTTGRRAGLVCLALLLSACAPEEFPENPLLAPVGDLAMPAIVPLDPLLAQITPAVDAANPDPELASQGEALRARAAAEIAPAPEQSAEEAQWAAQSEALRARAEAARQTTP
jgi:hypothetical protein